MESLAVPETDLSRALGVCRRRLDEVVTLFEHGDVSGARFDSLYDAWRTYYFQPFASFDRLLQQSVLKTEPQSFRFVPVSISHHNLHRLMEVLRREVGNNPLGETRAPERILDLVETGTRLRQLVQTVLEA